MAKDITIYHDILQSRFEGQGQLMNSRERVRAAIRHQPTDILPVDFGGMRSTGINAVAYNRLLKALGVENRCARLYDVFQQLAEPDPEVLERLGGDVVQAHRLYPAFGIAIDRWRPSKLADGSDCLVPYDYRPVRNAKGGFDILDPDGNVISRMPNGGFYFDVIRHRFEDLEEPEDVDGVRFTPMSEKEMSFIENECRTLRETTDKAILFAYGGNVFEAGQTDFGFETFFCDLAANQEMLHRWFEKLTDCYLTELRALLPRIAPYIDVIQMGDDLGTQLTTQISPAMYREMIKPYHRKIYGYVRENFPEVKVFLHSCGAICDLIPDLIDAGVEILNPVQISANGMDPAKLRREFGADLTFWGGGANMQTFVPTAAPDQIREHVDGLIRTFYDGRGGYVFTQVHNIQYNVEPEKILAIYDTARRYR